jgi:AcrR family transcriptional regulator
VTLTPWGDMRELRARTPTPGASRRAQDVERELRERIYAATVTTVADRGYPVTRVADIVDLAGVSHGDFHELFDDRLDCFVQTLEAIIVLAEAAMALELARDEPWDARLRRSFDTLIDLIVAQPAAARMCLVDAYVAGPDAVALVDRMTRAAGRRAVAVLEESPERSGIPRNVARAVIGGLRKVIQTRLYGGREDELPGLAPTLMDWALSYRTPPVRLRDAEPPTSAPRPHPRDRDDPRQRIVDAVTEVVAEEGYVDATVAEITEVAAMPTSAFYEHFDDKRDAFLAALDDAVLRALGVTMPAYRDARDWPRGVHDGLVALFAHLSLDPTLARFTVQTAWGGPEALTRFDATTAGFRALLVEGLRGRSSTSGVVAEAIGSSILALVYEETVRASPGHVYELTPSAAFVALAPSVGAIEACAVINGS